MVRKGSGPACQVMLSDGMAVRVEPVSKRSSAASAFRKFSRILAPAVGDRKASRPAAEVRGLSGRFEDIAGIGSRGWDVSSC